MFKLRFENFRSFINDEFDFSRINILIGENSSGKSSVLKFIMALKQSIQYPASRQLNLNLRGEYTDLGSYKDAIYYNDESRDLKFTFTFSNHYYDYFIEDYARYVLTDFELEDEEGEDFNPNYYRDIQNDQLQKIIKNINGPFTGETKLSYKLNKDLDDHNSILTEISHPEIGELQIIHHKGLPSVDKKLLFISTCTLSFHDYESNSFITLTEVEYDKLGFMSLISGSSISRVLEYFLRQAGLENDELESTSEKVFQKIAFLLVSQNYLKSALESVEYFNPLLTKPSRVYLARDQRFKPTINDIEDLVEFFASNNPESTSIFNELTNILSEYGIVEGIELLQDNRMLVSELRVRVKDLVSNIFDVGYGVALQIPMILKAMLAERNFENKNTILLIEQPEVHLHPRLHAVLIEIFLRLGTRNIYFIETHSEHIIRKLQVMVKKDEYKLDSSDVSINYLSRQNQKSLVSKHVIQENGFLVPKFPSGFFDASYNLSKELLD